MKQSFTLQHLKEMRDYCRQQAIKPCVIKTKAEADRLTRQDKVFMARFGIKGRKWKIGDSYYLLKYFNGGEHETPFNWEADHQNT